MTTTKPTIWKDVKEIGEAYCSLYRDSAEYLTREFPGPRGYLATAGAHFTLLAATLLGSTPVLPVTEMVFAGELISRRLGYSEVPVQQ
ncbi:MAG: hypothetical protein V1820_05460 [archaeon]